MKIQKKNNYSFNFKSGLTNNMKKEILSCDVQKISNEFSKQGIVTDFKNNQVVAWSSLKCLEIIKSINKQFDLNLALPKGIFVEDFRNLNILNTKALGFCNTFPTKVYKDFEQKFPEKTIFFNEYMKGFSSEGNLSWENIDEYADYNKMMSYSSTDFFLDIILHEFTHVIHIDNLLKKLGVENYLKGLVDLKEKNSSFRKKYYNKIAYNSCLYAGTNPMESVACDMSKRIITSLNQVELKPNFDFTECSPYKEYSFKDILLSRVWFNGYDKLIKRFWDGNFK